MKGKNMILAFLLILFVMFLMGRPSFAATTAKTRLSGQTQFETAKAISEQFKPGKVQNVILSTGNGFADALSAGVLAHQLDAPILLVDSSLEGSKEGCV